MKKKNNNIGKYIIFLDRIVNLYLYFVVMACFLSLIPNINPNYPLFHFIFNAAGFYLIPPILGIFISPAIVMVGLALISLGLNKIYEKYFKEEVIFLNPQVFMEASKEFKKQNNIDKEINNDGNEDNRSNS